MTTTTDRNPYIGEGADGARRSAVIDREELDTLDAHDPRRETLLESARRWDEQAERLEAELVEPVGVVVVHPITGEVLDLGAGTPTDVIAEAFEDIGLIVEQVIDVRQRLADELARRMDTVNTRQEQVGEWVIEVNAGTEERYQPPATREALEPLVTDGVLTAEAIAKLITWRPGSAGHWAVDKREVNKLKRHPNPAVQQALAKARTINPVTRKVKVAKVVTLDQRVGELEEGGADA